MVQCQATGNSSRSNSKSSNGDVLRFFGSLDASSEDSRECGEGNDCTVSLHDWDEILKTDCFKFCMSLAGVTFVRQMEGRLENRKELI